MKVSKEEYESLRNEIITLEEVQRNVWLHMYVIFCSLFVLGLQWSYYLFLVVYVVIIPFQCVYNDYWWSISKISTYIRIFYEEENKNMNWESFHVHSIFREYYNKKRKNIVDQIRFSGSVFLGILSTGFFCGYTLKNTYYKGVFNLGLLDVLLIILSVLLLLAIIIINKTYSNKVYSELEDVTRGYKKYVDEISKNA